MTTWYVSSAATGTGTGTQASPWDMTQAFAGAATGDTVYAINDGTYSEAAQLAPTNNNWLLQGYQTTPGDSGVITMEANVTGSGPYPNLIFENCAYFNCTSLGIGTWINPVALTADPFVNPTATINSLADAQAAFSLNNTAGGGALCRGAGTPQYLDIGATQHQDSGGGGVPRIVVPRRMW